MLNIIKGIIIGMGIVIPGVSGSVLAIMLGVYDKVINIINNFSMNRKNIIYLLSLVIGIFLGISLFGNIILKLIKINEVLVCYLFCILILMGIPTIYKKLSKYGYFDYKYFIISLLTSLIIFVLNKINISNINSNSLIILFIGGILFISGKIIPGISSSFFMMILGLYNTVLSIMVNPFSKNIYFYIEMIPFFIGCIVGFILLTKIINFLLEKHYSKTYSCIIGFILGSTLELIPKFNIIYIIILIIVLLFIIKRLKSVKY